MGGTETRLSPQLAKEILDDYWDECLLQKSLDEAKTAKKLYEVLKGSLSTIKTFKALCFLYISFLKRIVLTKQEDCCKVTDNYFVLAMLEANVRVQLSDTMMANLKSYEDTITKFWKSDGKNAERVLADISKDWSPMDLFFQKCIPERFKLASVYLEFQRLFVEIGCGHDTLLNHGVSAYNLPFCDYLKLLEESVQIKWEEIFNVHDLCPRSCSDFLEESDQKKMEVFEKIGLCDTMWSWFYVLVMRLLNKIKSTSCTFGDFADHLICIQYIPVLFLSVRPKTCLTYPQVLCWISLSHVQEQKVLLPPYVFCKELYCFYGDLEWIFNINRGVKPKYCALMSDMINLLTSVLPLKNQILFESVLRRYFGLIEMPKIKPSDL